MSATLVTGASGFIGLNLVEALLAGGADVVAFDTRPLPDRAARAFAALPGRLTEVVGDVADAASLDRAFAGPVGRIVHAAAITSDAGREAAMPERIAAVNVLGAILVLEAAKRHGAGRVLLVSSAAVYGAAPAAGSAWTEDSPLLPESLYAVTKLTAELAGRRLAALTGLSLVIGRLGWIFGPWEHRSGARDTMSPVFQVTTAALAGRSARLPRPDRRMWTYSRDAAAALVALLGAPTRHPVYNVASGIRIDLDGWGRRLAARRPGFRCTREGPADVTIDLFADADPPGLGTGRFDGELAAAWRDEDAMFDDYLGWLADDPWPAADTSEGNRS